MGRKPLTKTFFRGEKLIFETVNENNITNGKASYIEQEELERYDGYWWNPQKMEIIYERVDESPVINITF